MSSHLEVIKVSCIFDEAKYVIPIYQRNYAWEASEIEQLIEDIMDNPIDQYYLGNLIVNQTDNDTFEVIDGQQRLTTLFLLEKCLGMTLPKDALRFEAREKSNRTLEKIPNDDWEHLKELYSEEIINGYNIIENYMKANKLCKKELLQKLEKTLLIRVQVPKDIDLNHYFEIMNTRGEQLELHEIAKAKFLEVLETEEDRHTAALIWDKCAEMDSYVQMNFDSKVRNQLFSEDWSSLKNDINGFESIQKCLSNQSEERQFATLEDILQNRPIYNEDRKNEEENERFESIISFPNFLLQVNAAWRRSEEKDSSLDDKNLLDNLSRAWENADAAKDFLFHLLKCRVLFDKYIVKREYARTYKEDGRWSLQRLKKYDNNKPQYINTFGDEESKQNKLIKTLQACLRITYTSPKTMHWITVVLKNLSEDENCNLLEILENYCKEKVKASNYQNASGFEFERIVFTYLDYLLYKNGYSYKNKRIIAPMDDWEVQFRNSIEHFYPRNPANGIIWNKQDLDDFGNLALITVSGNSKFSNLPPEGKITFENLINQSLKLKIMKEMVDMGDKGWTEEKAKEHKNEMFNILKEHVH